VLEDIRGGKVKMERDLRYESFEDRYEIHPLSQNEKELPWYELLRDRREKSPLSQSEVAEKIGVDVKTVGRWERGERVPYPVHRRELAKLFKIDTKELIFQMGRGRRDKAVSLEEAENSQGARMRINRQKKGISLTELAKSLGYTKGYLSTVETGRILPPLTLIKQYEEALLLQPDELIDPPKTSEQQERPTGHTGIDAAHSQQKDSRKEAKEDWGEAPIVAAFYGREQELDVLKQWIIADRSQIVALLGLGGIGKSTLAVSAATHVKEEFDYIFWRSLQNAPSVEEVLKGCLQFLSDRVQSEVPEDFNEQVLLFIKILQ
jgi:transcriptional regulator with XRE-family HTH domain